MVLASSSMSKSGDFAHLLGTVFKEDSEVDGWRVAQSSGPVISEIDPKTGVPHFSRVSRSGAVPEVGIAAVELHKMKICEKPGTDGTFPGF
jgi:hypothetical protein